MLLFFDFLKMRSMLKEFAAKRQILNQLVESFSKNVNKFTNMEWNDFNETAVVEFTKISNFLLSEFEFLYNGKAKSVARLEMDENKLYYDLMLNILNHLDDQLKSEGTLYDKLNDEDCKLRLIGVNLDSLVLQIKSKISMFQRLVDTNALRVNYSIGSEKELSSFYSSSIDFESKHIVLDLTSPGFNLENAFATHSWVVKKKRKKDSLAISGDKKAKVVVECKSSQSQRLSTSIQFEKQKKSDQGGPLALDQGKNQSATDQGNYPSTADQGCNPSATTVQGCNPPAKEQGNYPSATDQGCNPSATNQGLKLKKKVANYAFLNHSILVETNFFENEEKLKQQVSELFRMEQIDDERSRSFFIEVLSLCLQMKRNFLDFFIFLERTILKIKEVEVENFRTSDLFRSQSNSQKLRTIDSLQRKARRFVSKYGRLVYEFLEAYKLCSSELEQIVLLNRLWPLSSLADDTKTEILTKISGISISLSAEDCLLLNLSVEGFQSLREDLYTAIQDANVLQLYASGEKDNCIDCIQAIVTTNKAFQWKGEFGEKVWLLVGEYYNSNLPKVRSTKELPWELRTRAEKKKVEEDAHSLKKKRKRKHKVNDVKDISDVEDSNSYLSTSVCQDIKNLELTVHDDDKGNDGGALCSTSHIQNLEMKSFHDDKENDGGAQDFNSHIHNSAIKPFLDVDEVNDGGAHDGAQCSTSLIPNSEIKPPVPDNDKDCGGAQCFSSFSDIDKKKDDSGCRNNIILDSGAHPKNDKFDSACQYDSDYEFAAGDDDEDFDDEDDYVRAEDVDNFNVDHELSKLLNHFSVEEIWEDLDEQWAGTCRFNGMEFTVDLTIDKDDNANESQCAAFSPLPKQSQFLSKGISIVTPESNRPMSVIEIETFRKVCSHIAAEFNKNEPFITQPCSHLIPLNVVEELNTFRRCGLDSNPNPLNIEFGKASWATHIHMLCNIERDWIYAYINRSRRSVTVFSKKDVTRDISLSIGLFCDNLCEFLKCFQFEEFKVITKEYIESDCIGECGAFIFYVRQLSQIALDLKGIESEVSFSNNVDYAKLKSMIYSDTLLLVKDFLDIVN